MSGDYVQACGIVSAAMVVMRGQSVRDYDCGSVRVLGVRLSPSGSVRSIVTLLSITGNRTVSGALLSSNTRVLI